MQQCIELRRNGRLTEARQHARKYLTNNAGTYSDEVNKAAGLLAFTSDTTALAYRVGYCSQKFCPEQLTLILLENVLARPLGLPCGALCPKPSQAILASSSTSPPYRSFCGPFSAEDSLVPLRARQQHSQCQLDNNFRMSDMLDRAQRTGS